SGSSGGSVPALGRASGCTSCGTTPRLKTGCWPGPGELETQPRRSGRAPRRVGARARRVPGTAGWDYRAAESWTGAATRGLLRYQVRCRNHDDAHYGQAQVGVPLIAGEEVEVGQDHPVEDVQQESHDRLDVEMVDGPADAHEHQHE